MGAACASVCRYYLGTYISGSDCERRTTQAVVELPVADGMDSVHSKLCHDVLINCRVLCLTRDIERLVRSPLVVELLTGFVQLLHAGFIIAST